MNILPPSQNPVLIGHDGALVQIKTAFASGRMPHAWVITGIEGIGKATLAYHMANFALSNGLNSLGNLNMQDAAARLIAAEAHPDLFVLQRATDEKTGQVKEIIPTEAARKIAPFLHMTAMYGGWRVAIIDQAHALNRHGQNAILKVIEEPPAKCLIILTATTPGSLLPTIRSRCRMLPLQPLNEAYLQTVLARCDVSLPNDDIGKLVRLSSGSPGFALRLVETEGLLLFDDVLGVLRGMSALDMGRAHALADRIGKKGDADKFAVVSQLLTNALRETAHQKATGQGYTDISLAAPLDRSLQLWDKIRDIFAQTKASNLDPKLAFVNALTEIKRAS